MVRGTIFIFLWLAFRFWMGTCLWLLRLGLVFCGWFGLSVFAPGFLTLVIAALHLAGRLLQQGCSCRNLSWLLRNFMNIANILLLLSILRHLWILHITVPFLWQIMIFYSQSNRSWFDWCLSLSELSLLSVERGFELAVGNCTCFPVSVHLVLFAIVCVDFKS